jgi:4-amino-4-deoxychorismate lyase
MSVLVNGRPGNTLDVLDRGLQYGDGLFETIAIRASRPRLLRHHLERLADGCRRLLMDAPDPDLIVREIAAVASAPAAVVKVIVTRGVGGRGYRPPRDPQATRIVASFPWPDRSDGQSAGGIRLRTCTTRLSSNPRLAGIKHLGRLEQVLARAEWQDESIAEGLMLDEAGHVVCGTQSNLFALMAGELVTPRVDRCGVAGVMRRAVLEWASAQGVTAREVDLRPDELPGVEELFVTNAIVGAWPARELDGVALPRGTMAAEFNRWLEHE